MTSEDLRFEKRVLETEILKMLLEFKENTTFQITSIDILTASGYGQHNNMLAGIITTIEIK